MNLLSATIKKEENEMMPISKGKVINASLFIITLLFFVGSIFHVQEASAEKKRFLEPISN
jgi:hypothetical protein